MGGGVGPATLFAVTGQQAMVVLDVEGVLTPEIWIAVAERTGIDELRRTTRDEPDYDVLMKSRLAALDAHGVTFSLITEVIETLEPLDGAVEFMRELQTKVPVVLLSDTFAQFAGPLMAQLAHPTLFCHDLVITDDRIADYRLRLPDQKRRAVEAFHGLNFRVVAAGDSYNDTSMLLEADAGILFRAPDNVIEEFGQFPACTTHDELLEHLLGAVRS